MVLFNYATKEITAKIVYYGPGLCGKTTNLQFIYDSLPSNSKSKMLSLATKQDRTLFFDFLPLDLGKIRGMRTKLQLYTVPGQVYYNSTRELVLKGADGVVFVADSQDFALDANHESYQNLADNLKKQRVRLDELPVVMQWNKRDLDNALPIEELEKELNQRGTPSFPSVATTGIGVEETLKKMTELVLSHLIDKYGLEGDASLDKEIRVLNPPTGEEAQPKDTVWTEDNVLATTVATPGNEGLTPDEPHPAWELTETDDVGEEIPVVETQLIQEPAVDDSPGTFENMMASRASRKEKESPMEVPIQSVEIPLPESVRESLPDLEAQQREAERRRSDGLVKEITIPLNLSSEELRDHRKLKLKITIDVNLLP